MAISANESPKASDVDAVCESVNEGRDHVQDHDLTLVAPEAPMLSPMSFSQF